MPRLVRQGGAAAAVVVGAWLVWGWLFPSDEARIRAVLDRVADAVGAGAAEGEIARLARVAGLRQDFHPDLIVDAGPPFSNLRGREAVVAAAARTGAMMHELEVSFAEIVVALDADRQRASVTLVAEARFREGEGAGQSYDARELEVEFVRYEERWVVAGVVLVAGLQPLS